MKKLLGSENFKSALFLISLIWLSLGPASGQANASEIVLYASEASQKVGACSVVSDSSAAGGSRLYLTDFGAPKLSSPLASPATYFEMSFNVEAGRAYRLWIRGKALNNYWGNDSVWVQFSGSVNSSGSAIYRIGTTSGTSINLEDCSGCGLSGWGWQDDGWGVGVLGPVVYFQSTGTQTIRIQNREDGLSIDQIVLSSQTYLNSSPGSLKNDSTILPKTGSAPPPSSSSQVVIWASDIPDSRVFGNWSKVYNSSAANQTALRLPDNGAPKLSSPLASPTHYFEMSFNAEAGRAYRLWIRGRADNNYWGNDSVWVQFSGSVNSSGSAMYRIGTTSGADVNLEDCSGCGLSGWGWQDNGWGIGVLGPVIYFQSTGTQTIRVQNREDGFSIDQIVLSSQTYLNSSPGSLKNDSTILPSTIGSTAPPPSNQPPQVSVSATPTSGTAPLAVNFTSSSSDPDGYIVGYSWTFGDGNTSNYAHTSNVYQSAGTYTARLTVTDNAGATTSASVTINVGSASTSGTQLKVLSYNVSFGKGTDNIFNLDRTATWMASLGADLIGLCEMPPEYVSNLVTLMSQKTGRSWYGHFVAKYPGCPEGNLILSKFPFVSTGHRYLSYERSVAQVTVSVGGRYINFFATHLDHTSSSLRWTQANEVKSFASGYAEPRIIVGDFNAGPDTSEIANMTSAYYDGWYEAMNMGLAVGYPDNPVGLHTRTRRGRIDYVFYSRGTSYLTVKAAQVPDSRDLNNKNVVVTLGTLDDKGVRPSDHNHMLVTLEVR